MFLEYGDGFSLERRLRKIQKGNLPYFHVLRSTLVSLPVEKQKYR